MKLIILIIYSFLPIAGYFLTRLISRGSNEVMMTEIATSLLVTSPVLIALTGFIFHVWGYHTSRWISIKDEEPKQGVLLWYYAPIFGDGPCQWVGEYYGNGSFGGKHGHLGGNEVTHWQYVEIPKP